jgi:acetolactate synthase-1/2/3 large subunit
MRICDFIANRLAEHGVKFVYGLMGGGASGLNDGFIKNPDINYICFHHEQGAAYAAVGESKITNKISVVNPTTGCGGGNCITPLMVAWQDSLPVVFISGNVKLNQISSYIGKQKNVHLRKYGIQENDIISVVKSMTKYSKLIESVEELPEILDFAIETALDGRMGPVWLDIPSDIQHAKLPENYKTHTKKQSNSPQQSFNILDLISNAKRPLIVAGNGIHLSNSREAFSNFIHKHNIPFVSSYLAIDLVPFEDPLSIGSIGIKGSRAGNFAIQNCDLLLILGCSLNCSHTGYDERLFSPNSYKIMVDIDKNEYSKDTVKIDKFIETDLGDFFKNVK